MLGRISDHPSVDGGRAVVERLWEAVHGHQFKQRRGANDKPWLPSQNQFSIFLGPRRSALHYSAPSAPLTDAAF